MTDDPRVQELLVGVGIVGIEYLLRGVLHHRSQHGDGEMRELGCALIELQATDSAVFLEVIGYTRFRNAQVLGHALLQPRQIFRSATSTDEIANGNAQRLA